MKYVGSILAVTLLTILLVGAILRSSPQILRLSDSTISVLVEDETGGPLPRARVQVLDESASETLVTTFTDSAGVASIVVPSGVATEDPAPPQSFTVNAAYPNPMGSAGQRRLSITYSAPISYAHKPQVEVFDILGRRVSVSRSISSGVYLYRLDFGDGRISKTRTIVVTESGPVEVRLVRSDHSIAKRTNVSMAKTQGLRANFVIESEKPGYVTASRLVETGTEDVNLTLQMLSADLPEAVFAVSGTLESGSLVTFDGGPSSDPSGAALQYSWDFGNGKRAGGQRVTHTYLAAGSYNVALVVSGSFGATDTTRQTIEIESGPQPVSLAGRVSGTVLDQLGNPLSDVTVSVVGDTITSVTGRDGIASLDGVGVGIPVFLRLERNGFSSQQVSVFLESDTTEANFRAALIERNTPLRIDNVENGASVSGADGARLEIPYDGLIDENGRRVTGAVAVNLTPVDVVEQTAAFPGRFEAVNQDGSSGGLLSYGVVEFNLEQDGGKVQLAPGRTAAVEIPIYTGGTQIGEEIALWSVDEDTGQWTQEGTGVVVASIASPTGLALRADVTHFSWWNCDDFFDPDVRNPGVCYKQECDTGVCFDVPVGCWAGGRRKPLQKTGSRMQTAPVFEVRTYINPAGTRLFFPPGRETEVVATALGGLFEGRVNIVGVAGNESPLDIILEPTELQADTIRIAYGDTLTQSYAANDDLKVYGFFVAETDGFELTIKSDGFEGNLTLDGNASLNERALSASRTVVYQGNGIGDQTYFLLVDGSAGTPGGFTVSLRRTGTFEWIDFDENGEVYVEGDIGPDERLLFAFRGEAGDGVYAEIVEAPGAVPAVDMEVNLRRWAISPFDNCCVSSSIASNTDRLDESRGEYAIELDDRRDNGGSFALRVFKVEHSTEIIVDDDLSCVGADTRSFHAAVAAADPEALVTVCPGEYRSLGESATVYSNGVQIVGADQATTVVPAPLHTGRAEPATLRIEAPGVSVRNISVGGHQRFTCCTGAVNVSAAATGFEISNARIYGQEGASDGGRGIDAAAADVTVTDVEFENLLLAVNTTTSSLTFTNNTVANASGGVEGGVRSGVVSDLLIQNNDFDVLCQAVDVNAGRVLVEDNVMLGDRSDPRCTMLTANALQEEDPGEIVIRGNTIRTAGSGFRLTQNNRNDVTSITAEQNVVEFLSTASFAAVAMETFTTEGSTLRVINNTFDRVVNFEGVLIGSAEKADAITLANNNFRGNSRSFNDIATAPLIQVKASTNTYAGSLPVTMVNNLIVGLGNVGVGIQDGTTIDSDFNLFWNVASRYAGGSSTTATSDFELDPLLEGEALRITTASPAVDAGASAGQYPVVPSVDLTGTARPAGAGVDIGAHEVN